MRKSHVTNYLLFSIKLRSIQRCAEVQALEHTPEKRLNFLVTSIYWLQHYPEEN